MSFSHVCAVCTISLDTDDFVNAQGGDIDLLKEDLTSAYLSDIRYHVGNGALSAGIGDFLVDEYKTNVSFTEDPSGTLYAKITLDVLFEDAKENGISDQRLDLNVRDVFQCMANEGQLSVFDDIVVDDWKVDTSSDLRGFLGRIDSLALEDYANQILAVDKVDYVGDGQFYLGRGTQTHSTDELIGMLVAQMPRCKDEKDHYIVYVDEMVGELEFDSRFLTSVPVGTNIQESIDSIMRSWREYVTVETEDNIEYVYEGKGKAQTSIAYMQGFKPVSDEHFEILKQYMEYYAPPSADQEDGLDSGVGVSPQSKGPSM